MKDFPIEQFIGEYRWLSNFEPSPIEYIGGLFPTVEHAYQSAKTTNMFEQQKVMACLTPGAAKRVGQHLTLRPDWTEETRLSTMRFLLEKKFEIPELREKLLATGESLLVEGNHWNDTFWGVCNGEGENHLGKLIMEVRKQIRGN